MTSSKWTAIVGSSGALADSAIHVNLVVFLKSCEGEKDVICIFKKVTLIIKKEVASWEVRSPKDREALVRALDSGTLCGVLGQ